MRLVSQCTRIADMCGALICFGFSSVSAKNLKKLNDRGEDAELVVRFDQLRQHEDACIRPNEGFVLCPPFQRSSPPGNADSLQFYHAFSEPRATKIPYALLEYLTISA